MSQNAITHGHQASIVSNIGPIKSLNSTKSPNIGPRRSDLDRHVGAGNHRFAYALFNGCNLKNDTSSFSELKYLTNKR